LGSFGRLPKNFSFVQRFYYEERLELNVKRPLLEAFNDEENPSRFGQVRRRWSAMAACDNDCFRQGEMREKSSGCQVVFVVEFDDCRRQSLRACGVVK
jgi:hypothetical protein